MTPAAPWVNVRDVVYVADGPLGGRWYFTDGDSSWQLMREAAEAMADTRPTRDQVLDHELTDELTPHPSEDVVGKTLRYRGEIRR